MQTRYCYPSWVFKDKVCNQISCPAATSGEGNQNQNRHSFLHEAEINETIIKEHDCNKTICPESWSEWTDLGGCSVTCGEGKQYQTKTRFLPWAKINETIIEENVCNQTKCTVFKWDSLRNLTFEEKKEMMKEELVELKANLTVDRKNTSAAIRRKTSARDDRTSASSLGSCIDVYLFNRNSSGSYTLYQNGNPIEVYCSFEGDSGYTYVSKSSLETSFDLSKLFTTRNFANIRTLLSNGTQKEVTVENINRDALYFGLIEDNVSPHFFIEFSETKSLATKNKIIQGYRAQDENFTCPVSIDNSLDKLRFKFYHNSDKINVQTDGDLNNFTTGWMKQSSAIDKSKYMDIEFYFPFDMSMRGCGKLMTSNQVFNTKAALGLPFGVFLH
ncbi:unnamed protein product [Mytilus coruscus]|uniref:Uncharacterized protein n=1 Tax=Mytilus coruscus TaxID=42192 RepID=A0A6J8D6F9_MYTCO|nr:unnamed protein product [Mytilus coruscus]